MRLQQAIPPNRSPHWANSVVAFLKVRPAAQPSIFVKTQALGITLHIKMTAGGWPLRLPFPHHSRWRTPLASS